MSLTNDSLPPSSLPQQGNNSSRNYLNTFQSEQTNVRAEFWFLPLPLYATSFAVAVMWWALISMKLKIIKYDDDQDYWTTAICFILMYLISPAMGYLTLDELSVLLLPLVVDEKVLRGEEEETEIEIPTWFSIIPAAGCFLFLLVTGLLSWQINGYLLDKASYIFKLGPDDGFWAFQMKLFWPILGCFGIELSLALAFTLASVTILISRANVATNRVADVEMLPADDDDQLPPPESKIMKKIRVLEATRSRAWQLSILLFHRLISYCQSKT